jgi:hypothetical protein
MKMFKIASVFYFFKFILPVLQLPVPLALALALAELLVWLAARRAPTSPVMVSDSSADRAP